MRELEDALEDMKDSVELAKRIAAVWWNRWSVGTPQDGREIARSLHQEYPRSSPAELLAVSRASGILPTEAELEGWEQYWIELGLDNQPEVEHTASTGWHQPPLPGLESI